MAQEFNVANVNAKFTASGLNTVNSQINKLGVSVQSVTGLIAGLGAAFSVKSLASSLFQTTKKLEQMKMAITAVSKSAAEADSTFARIKEWAEKNPVNTDDAISAFVRLRTAGVQNAESAITQIADLATVQGRTMADVASAIVTTEVEPLRNLGIQLDRTGKQAVVKFGEVTKTCTKDIDTVRSTILEVLSQAIPNAMDRAKNSVTGSLNTLGGMWQGLQADIMGWGTTAGGVFDNIGKYLIQFRQSWEEWMGSADYKRFVSDVSGALNTLLDLFVGGVQKVGALTKAMYEHKDALLALVSGIAAYKIGMSGLSAVINLFSGNFGAWISMFPMAITSVQNLTTWIGLLGVSISTTTGVFAVMAALIGGIVYRNMKLAEREAQETATAFEKLDKEFKNANASQLKAELASVEAQLKQLQAQAIKTQISVAEAMEAEQTGDYSKVNKSVDLAKENQAREKDLKTKRKYIEERLKQLKTVENAEVKTQKAINSVAATGTKAKGKSETELLIDSVDAQVKYTNADLAEMITLLEAQQGKLKPLSEDWTKITDKIKELKSQQSQINDLTNDNAVTKGIKDSSASLTYYLAQLNELKTRSGGMLTVQERLQQESSLLSKANGALSTAIQEINTKFGEQKLTAQQASAALAELAGKQGLTQAQTKQLAEATKTLNNEISSKAVSNILYGVEIGALKATEAMNALRKMTQETMASEGATPESYATWSERLKNEMSALGQVASQVAAPAMEMLQKRYETGVITLPQYIAQLEQVKQQYAGIGEVVTSVDEKIKNAKATASTFGSRMQAAIGDADKAVTELNSTALTGLADGFARAVSYGEDFGDCLKSLVQDITYTITKMLMLKAITAMFGGLFGGVSGGNVYDAASMGWQTLEGMGRHTGGIAGTDAPTFTRSLPRFHTGGIVGTDEELAILKKGEGVFTKGQMDALGSSISKNETVVQDSGTQIGSMTLNISAIDSQSFAAALTNNKAVVENIIVHNVMSNGNVRRTMKAALA